MSGYTSDLNWITNYWRQRENVRWQDRRAPHELTRPGPPIDSSFNGNSPATITGYSSTTGVYTAQLLGVAGHVVGGAITPLYALASPVVTVNCYDTAMLDGRISQATQRFSTGSIVQVNMSQPVYTITEPDTFSFYPFVTDAQSVHITSGHVNHVWNGLNLQVNEEFFTGISNNDYVWVQRTSANTWELKTGSALPTTFIFQPMFKFTVSVLDGGMSYITGIQYLYAGGDMIISESFPVVLSASTGAAGSVSTTCAFTYTVKTLGGIDIFGSTTAPVNYRTANCQYNPGTVGSAWIKADGTFAYVALDEGVIGKNLAKVYTGVSWDGTTLTGKYRAMTVLDADASDSSETIDTSVGCS